MSMLNKSRQRRDPNEKSNSGAVDQRRRPVSSYGGASVARMRNRYTVQGGRSIALMEANALAQSIERTISDSAATEEQD